MVFSSPRFLVFLVAVLLLLRVPWPHRYKKLLLTCASCLFYAAWDYRYLALLGTVSVVDYFVASRIHETHEPGRRKAWLCVSLVSNFGLLAYFKYYNFLIDNLNPIAAGLLPPLPHQDILLPIGISFYTFKTLSYTIDVYRRTLAPAKSLADYAMFVTFFPELIAGPIVRASVFLPQMTRQIGPTADRLAAGLSLFLLGMTKKLLIADRLATVADPVFAAPENYSGATIWLGVIAYTVQIYCDFSGYSDMAIGVAKMLGYDLPENFNMPYLSASVTEFWRRWHMTLSFWLRDYLYIPLGGNRKGYLRTYLNLTATMLLGGLWHGASWNFVLWGGLHGTALAAHRLYRERLGEREGMPSWLAVPATLLFVTLCWVPFRASSFAVTGVMLERMLTLSADGATWLPTALWPALVLVVLGHAAGVVFDGAERMGRWSESAVAALRMFGAGLRRNEISGWSVRFGLSNIPGVCLVETWVLMIFFYAPTHSSPFIYFQF